MRGWPLLTNINNPLTIKIRSSQLLFNLIVVCIYSVWGRWAHEGWSENNFMTGLPFHLCLSSGDISGCQTCTARAFLCWAISPVPCFEFHSRTCPCGASNSSSAPCSLLYTARSPSCSACLTSSLPFSRGLQHTASLVLRHTALPYLVLSLVPLFQGWTLPPAHMHPWSLRPMPPSSKKPLLLHLCKVTPWPVFLPPHFPLSEVILPSYQGQDRTMRAHTCLQSPPHSPLPGTGGPVLDPLEEISNVSLTW